jgi:hypothetical protein
VKSIFRRTALASALATIATGALLTVGPAQVAFADCTFLNGHMEWRTVPEGWSTPPMWSPAGPFPGQRCQNGRLHDYY